MIRIGNDYAIKADDKCFSLHSIKVADKDTKERKAGEEYTESLGLYYSDVSACLQGLARKLRRDAVSEPGEIDLKEAARRFREIESHILGWEDQLS